MEDIEQIVTFLEAWAVDQKIVAKGKSPTQEDWFLARSEALRDAAMEIKARSYKDGLRAFHTLATTALPEPPQ